MQIKKIKEIDISSKHFDDSNHNAKMLIYKADINDREIWAYRLNNVTVSSESIYYPSIELFSEVDSTYYLPIDEEVMSLKSIPKRSTGEISSISFPSSVYHDPLFFFIYNTDNYFHFLYDSLPYLITFLKLREYFPNIKLLISSPNFQINKPYPFFFEFLELLDIYENDLVFIDKKTKYTCIFISDSYTHSGKSEKPPRDEIYELYLFIKNKARSREATALTPEKIYISRRTWIHGDVSNIGTNYTQKRRLENENALVDYLNNCGFKEIFTENLSTIDKINIFSNAKFLVGASGGGLCNALFSTKKTKLLAINSPGFMEVNGRFIYSYKNVQTYFFDETFHTTDDKFKKYMRIYSLKNNIVGEVEEFISGRVKVNYTANIVAGWNAKLVLNSIWLNEDDCVSLDKGLNSPWKINLNDFINFSKKIF